MSRQYNVTGMSCAACSARVQKAVEALDGVSSCSVSLLTNSMRIEGEISDDAVISAVKRAGYGASPKDGSKKNNTQKEENGKETTESRRLLILFLVSLCFLALLMYLSMGYVMWGFPLPSFLSENPLAIALCQLFLTLAILLLNQRFFINGTRGMLHGAPNMDTLVAMGSAAALIYSTAVLFSMTGFAIAGDLDAVTHGLHDLYFESAAMIPVLITLGKLLEAKAKGRATSAIKALTELAPKTATVIRDGEEISIPVEEIKKGDIFVVRPGESIPTDGVVIEGLSAVNEAALTGESIPVDKQKGSDVFAATINQSGFLKCEATRVGEETTLSRIIQMVTDASATKAPIAKIADKVASVFVPSVIAIATVTCIVWLLLDQSIGFSLARAISVLVISCPCALGLATPVAIIVGSGKGAKSGILFKTAVSLESAGRISTVVLDKTGTVTNGTPTVTDLLPAEGVSEVELLTVAYALEQKSEHPLSRAIREYAAEKGISPVEVTDFEILPGKGLVATQNGVRLHGGNNAYLASVAVLPSLLSQKADTLAEQGKTPLYFAKEEQILGVIAVADTLKEDSPKAIRELREMGICVVMLTGDNPKTASAIGKAAGVDEVIAGVLPDGKAAKIQELKAFGKVAMVGDGINDAPALTQADLGMAIGAGTDVAIDAADVVLVKSRLSDVPAALRLGRATLRTIHQNLFWAFCYNIIGIPLAAGAFISLLGWELNPMFGAAAMSFSSVCVVSNALRLNLVNPYHHIHKKVRTKSVKRKKENKKMTKTIHITGMMCPHCEAAVKKALEALDGVESAVASHSAGTAVLTLSSPVSDELLKATVEAKDYEVTRID